MHQQYVDRKLLLAMLVFPIALCISFIMDTPAMLVMLSGSIVVIGILGWCNSEYLPSPWLVRLASTTMIVLGVAFLIWYFYTGRTILHPIFDVQKRFEAIQASLVTPTP